MRKHPRNPRQRLTKRETEDNHRLKLPAPPSAPEPDEVGNLIFVLLDQLRRTDALVTSAERDLVESWLLGGNDSGEDEDEDDSTQRRRMRVEYLVEAAKLEVRAAQYTGDQIAAGLAKRGGGGA